MHNKCLIKALPFPDHEWKWYSVPHVYLKRSSRAVKKSAGSERLPLSRSSFFKEKGKMANSGLILNFKEKSSL